MKLAAGQVAVVTGGASGIGKALAEAFRSRGLHVVIADVEQSALAATANEIGAHGLLTDVSRYDDVQRLADETIARFGRVDVICNNAGVSLGYLPSWEFGMTDWDWVLGVNLMGVIHGVKAFVPQLVRQGSGHVVNTSSAAGLGIIPGLAPYTVAKHGVTALSEMLRLELSERAPGVGVTVVSPGMVRTGIIDAGRNRPAHLAPPADRARETAVDRNVEMMEPADLAADVLAAIEADQLHVGPDVLTFLAEARLQQLKADLGG